MTNTDRDSTDQSRAPGGLTDAEIDETCSEIFYSGLDSGREYDRAIARAIEAPHPARPLALVMAAIFPVYFFQGPIHDLT